MKTRLLTIVVAAALATGVLLVVTVPSAAQVGPIASGAFPLPVPIPASAVNGAGVATVPLLVPDGTASLPGVAFASTPGLGLYKLSSTKIGTAGAMSFGFNGTGVTQIDGTNGFIQMGSATAIKWTTGTEVNTVDTGLSRTAAGTVAVGNGTASDASGKVLAASFAVGSSSVILSGVAPTISSGFGTGAAFQATNGPAAFAFQVGTGGVATSGVIGLPTVAGGWTCQVFNATARTGHRADNTVQTANTTSSVTFENQTTSTGAAVAWTASDQVRGSCFPF